MHHAKRVGSAASTVEILVTHSARKSGVNVRSIRTTRRRVGGKSAHSHYPTISPEGTPPPAAVARVWPLVARGPSRRARRTTSRPPRPPRLHRTTTCPPRPPRLIGGGLHATGAENTITKIVGDILRPHRIRFRDSRNTLSPPTTAWTSTHALRT